MAEEQTATLRVGEAVHLAHALLTRLAELEGVRILFIKGPTAVLMGARPPRPSSDVDVLCEPGGMEKLGAALERCGWRRRVPESANSHFVHAARYLFEHSVHYIHDEWPCDLDIHFNFPGFFAPDGVVFEALWERRATAEVAHWPVPCADFLGQAAIVGLHALREPQKVHSQADLEHVAATMQFGPPARLQELSLLAACTGSSETLRPVLQRVGAPTVEGQWSDADALRHWTIRTANPNVPTSLWLIALKHAPWSKRPLLLWRAAFPPRDLLVGQHHGAAHDWRFMTRLRTERFVRAIHNLRRGISVARMAERDRE